MLLTHGVTLERNPELSRRDPSVAGRAIWPVVEEPARSAEGKGRSQWREIGGGDQDAKIGVGQD